MTLSELYRHKHYESLLGICSEISEQLQWQELHLCALSMMNLKLFSEAEPLLLRLQNMVPKQMQLHIQLLLCQCHFEEKEWDEALELINEVYAMPEHKVLGARLSSYILWVKGDNQQAIGRLQEEVAHTKQPSPALLNSLGYMLVDSEVDIDQGYTYCHQALKAVPNYAAYLDSFGWACYKKGELEKALYLLKSAHLLEPKSKEIEKHFSIAQRG